MHNVERETPWQRVFRKSGLPSQSQFAKIFGWHRSKVSRALKDPKGFISGRDQERILSVSSQLKGNIKADDMLPRP